MSSAARFFEPEAVGSSIYVTPHLLKDLSLTIGVKVETTVKNYIDQNSKEEKTKIFILK